MVHKPIKLSEAKLIPEAQEALKKERQRLEAEGTWDITTVEEKRDVKARQPDKTKCHFGTIMRLCFLKNSEL